MRAFPFPTVVLCASLWGASARATAEAPLSLEDAVKLALRHHPQVAAAAASEDAAAARVGQARAPYLPQLGVASSLRQDYSYQTGYGEPQCAPGTDPCQGPRPDLSTFRYNAQLTLSQMLYDFGRTSGRLGAATASLRAARGDRRGTEAQIALLAITAYYAVLQAEALHEVAQRNLKQQEQRLQQAESFLRIGTRPEIDALTARTGKAQAELQALQARNTVLLARVQLLQAMGVTDAGWISRPLLPAPSAPIAVEEKRDVEEILEAALSARPEYEALRGRLTQAEAQSSATRADFLPQLGLTGGAGLSGSVGGQSFGSVGGSTRGDLPTAGQPGFSLFAGLTLNWAPFSGLQTVYAVRETDALLRVARANLEALRQQVRSGLQQALFQVQNSRQAARAAEAVLGQAELQLEQAAGRYEAGVGNIIELGDAQVGATGARAQRVQADYNLALSRAGLQLQLGQLVPKEGTR